MSTIEELQHLREQEDHVEFKEAKHNYPFAGSSKSDLKGRRHCVLGYIVALANERGGRLVLGMADKFPHEVVGSDFGARELGALEDEIYKRLYIRVRLEELFDDERRRVLVVNIPSRPLGKALKFEGVPLMRIGDSLREMDDQEYFNIISEQNPDFSSQICNGLTINGLDKTAIEKMRELIARKRSRQEALTLPLKQLLSDLGLITDGKLNYAALILLGKRDEISKRLPQNNVIVEYRTDSHLTRYSARREFRYPLFIAIDEIWNYINQPAANPLLHINDLPRIIDVPSFNEETIREALLNAMIHRSFQIQSDIMVKVSPEAIEITNSGGFPYGVNIGNILTVNSSPRSRLLAEVLEKTGLIERSGQGVDVMFANCIKEGRNLPDYSQSDDYQVALRIEAAITRPRMYFFIAAIEKSLPTGKRLNVFDLLTLRAIAEGDVDGVIESSVNSLITKGLILQHPRYKYVMGDLYFASARSVKSGGCSADVFRRLYYLFRDSPKPMSAIVDEFSDSLTPKQARTWVEKLCETILVREGNGKLTRYRLNHEEF